MTLDTATNALALAHAAALREGREVRSIRDLICIGCGVAVALRGDLCIACDGDVANHYDTKRAGETAEDFAALDAALSAAAEHTAASYDDPEGAAMLAGLNPGKL